MTIQTRQEGRVVIISIQGKIDFESTYQLRDETREAVANYQPSLMIINLEGVTTIDSSGLGVLMATHRVMERNYGKLCLCGLSSQVRRTFTQNNLLDPIAEGAHYFTVYDLESDAMSFGSKLSQ